MTVSVKASRSSAKLLRILALVSDAHGGFGGISQYNRDALEAMAELSVVAEVRVIPRLAKEALGKLPANIEYELSGLGGHAAFMSTVVSVALRHRSFDVIYCAHVNYVAVAVAIGWALRIPVILAIYGIDVWKAPGRLSRLFIRLGVSAVVSISEVTRQRFLSWCSYPSERTHLVPNAIHLENYGAGPKNPELIKRYGLADRTVLMTFGRMVGQERAKGFDEILELLPLLSNDIPNIIFLAIGEGPDRRRLISKARALGVSDRVVFPGRIDDSVKADTYRLADVYVMPSRGEGFGFVVLEALASGVPVVASIEDGTREAVRGGLLGALVDPDDPESIRRGILDALSRERCVPDGLEYFQYANFRQRLGNVLRDVCQNESQ